MKKASPARVGPGVGKRIVATTLAALLGWAGIGVRASALESEPAGAEALEPTPPRLVYTHGPVSFWRPGAEDWGPAQVNTPLAPGDLLHAAPGGTVELQVGARAFARATGGADGAEIGLSGLEPNYIQLKVAAGTLSLDLRDLQPGETVDVNTPDGVLTVERAGYYRIEAGAERTAFLADRGGSATLTIEDGGSVPVGPDAQVVVSGPTGEVAVMAAPAPSDWDRWNFARTDALLTAASARYVPAGVYGLSDLDRHGTWRHVPEYGPVWAPAGVSAGWAPYSTGRWIWDPHFEWTWVDDAPWGWAPYHYGRWVRVGDSWAWAPGPIVARPHYAPALVAFFQPVVVTVSRPVSWVALGWGEPCVPWWGRSRHAGRPWWGGWGGPRLARAHRNADVHHAIVTVPSERFGRGPVEGSRLRSSDVGGLRPLGGALGVRPTPASLVPRAGQGVTPPTSGRRPVMAARPPRDVSPRLRPERLEAPPSRSGVTATTRLVATPPREPRSPLAPTVIAPDRPRVAAPDREAPSRGGRPGTGEPRSVRDGASASGPALARPSFEPRAVVAPAPDPSPRGDRPRHPERQPRSPRIERQPREPGTSPAASRSTPPPVAPSGAGSAPRPAQDHETRRPALAQEAPLEMRSSARDRARPALEPRGAPQAIRHAPSRGSDASRPAIQAPAEDRRSAAPRLERAGRPDGARDARGSAGKPAALRSR